MGCGNPCVGMTWALARTAIIVVIGTTYLFGYNMVVINNPKRVLQNFYNTSYASRNDGTPMSDKTFTGLWSFTAAIYSIGILSASFLTGRLANRFGRKRLMLMNSVVVLAGCLLMGLSKKANSFEMIIVGRLVFGLAAGFSSVATLYFMEISPRHLRGAMGGLYEFGFATSMLLSQLLGLEEVFGNEKFWTLLLCITAITTVFQLVSLPFSPESPRFLLCSQQKEKEALESLQFFRGTTDPEELREELEELRHEHQSQKTRQNLSMLEIIKDPTLRNALYVSFAVHLSLQLGGVIPVLYFSTHLFNKAGVAYGESAHASLGIGCVKILMNLFSMFVIERFGRRLPELVGCGGQAIMLVLLTITMHDSFTV
ncbi:PREDICTED: solute carrier family 2, facilitated glucose transporter member 1-like [Priapulus caudatus]|uniref:Solute carrier family 2, facilitated glucose transporter member 1-like n=1 Tax=Priapulus caudatus TaxID=37621 RepID=A0ABM1DRD9_PRICU|nr:PREDICTED: solute carrier family 2, facilitated glucose transporter member 1-like [Priapulus caudatus]